MSTPPPPQGPNPYQQPQQPQQPQGFGAPQQGVPPQQPGYGPPQQGAPQGFPPPAAPAKRRGGARLLIRIGVLVLVVVIGIVIAVLNTDDSKTVGVGDCVKNTGSNSDPDLKQVGCTDSGAQYKILKKVSGNSDGNSVCGKVAGTTNYFTETEDGSSFVLCLKQLN